MRGRFVVLGVTQARVEELHAGERKRKMFADILGDDLPAADPVRDTPRNGR